MLKMYTVCIVQTCLYLLQALLQVLGCLVAHLLTIGGFDTHGRTSSHTGDLSGGHQLERGGGGKRRREHHGFIVQVKYRNVRVCNRDPCNTYTQCTCKQRS